MSDTSGWTFDDIRDLLGPELTWGQIDSIFKEIWINELKYPIVQIRANYSTLEDWSNFYKGFYGESKDALIWINYFKGLQWDGTIAGVDFLIFGVEPETFIADFDTVKAEILSQEFSLANALSIGLGKAIKVGLKFLAEDIFGINQNTWDSFTKQMIKLGAMDNNDKAELNKMINIFPEGRPLVIGGLILSYVTRFIGMFVSTTGGTMQKEMLKKFSPGTPDASSMLRGLFVDPGKTSEFIDRMRQAGLSPEDIDLMKNANKATFDIGTITTLFLRKIISDTEAREYLKATAYTEEQINQLIETWKVIPSAQDIFYMVGKEAFEPDMISKIGLGDEFPGEVSEWLSKQGYSDDWQKRYWYAHWAMPSIGQGYEMLHRRVIDDSELDMLFRAVEIPPFWRDKLKKISYNPYTRVDVRRMHDLGIIDKQVVYENYLDLGYDEERASNMTEFTLAYNEQNDKEITRTQIEQGYNEGIVSRDGALEMLVGIGYEENLAEFILTLIEAKRDERIEKYEIENIRELYHSDSITRQECITQLHALELTKDQVDLLIRQWDIRKPLKTKYPSKADIEKLFGFDVITQDEYSTELSKLGFSNKYVTWFTALALKQKAAREAKD